MLRDLYEARRRRKLKEQVGGLVISAGLAAIAGAAVGVLIAPQSGKETRENLIEGSKDVASKAKLRAKNLADEVYLRSLEAKKTARNTVERLSSNTEKLLNRAEKSKEDVLEEVEETAEELVENIEEKVEEVKEDLQAESEDN